MTTQADYSASSVIPQRLRAIASREDRTWVPDPMDSDSEAARFEHKDIPYLDDLDLEAEREFLLLIHYLQGAGPWELERIDVIKEELGRRGSHAPMPRRHSSTNGPGRTSSRIDPKQVASVDELLAREGGRHAQS